MRRIALPIAICLLASYGCAASEDSEPAGGGNNTTHGGTTGTGGSLGTSGTTVTSAGTAPGTGGTTSTTGGTTTTGTAGTTTTGTAGTTTTGTAGTTGTGGAAPGGGTCVMSAASMGALPMIDDFEDGNADVTAIDGRVGGWYLSTDMTGTTTPKAGAAMPEAGGMPGKALHVTGSGLTSWGASLAASLTPPMGCYDASKYTGITVMLKGTGSVSVSILTAAVRSAPSGMQNHFKKVITLTPEWTAVTINFSELTQPGGWGVIVPFDVTKIYGVDFGPVAAPPAPTTFDFWVDNLTFK